jgi:hypothetical protein
MSQVSALSIEKAIKKIDGLTEDALDKLIETYTLSQEELVNYILQAGAEYENEDLNIYGIYYFAIIYEAFLQEGLTPKKITEEDIDEFQEPFLEALDAIHKSENYGPLQELISQFNLQEFMVEEIESKDEDGEELNEETKTQLFIVSTALIGLLSEASAK